MGTLPRMPPRIAARPTPTPPSKFQRNPELAFGAVCLVNICDSEDRLRRLSLSVRMEDPQPTP